MEDKRKTYHTTFDQNNAFHIRTQFHIEKREIRRNIKVKKSSHAKIHKLLITNEYLKPIFKIKEN